MILIDRKGVYMKPSAVVRTLSLCAVLSLSLIHISVTHTYSAAGAVTLSASATDEDGTYHANTLSVNVTAPATFRVSQFTPTSTGFHVSFNRPIDPSALNLYAVSYTHLDVYKRQGR